MLFDTTFLVHLEREVRQNRQDRAHRFLRTHPRALLHISIITVGEFAAGFDESRQQDCWAALQRYAVLDLDNRTAWLYGQLHRTLRRANRLIGDNDLWIAATALQHGLPVVTDNLDHFQRIERLQVIGY
jgi:tRNA(fMet)-specific endonuclease VapC